jgi:hypothetical protein
VSEKLLSEINEEHETEYGRDLIFVSRKWIRRNKTKEADRENT